MPHERIPGKASTRRYTPPEKQQAVRLVRKLRDELGVEPICAALQVAPSTCCAAKRREAEPSKAGPP